MWFGARLDDGSFPRRRSFYPRAGWPLEWERRVSRSACLPEAVPIGSARHGYLKAMPTAYPSMTLIHTGVGPSPWVNIGTAGDQGPVGCPPGAVCSALQPRGHGVVSSFGSPGSACPVPSTMSPADIILREGQIRPREQWPDRVWHPSHSLVSFNRCDAGRQARVGYLMCQGVEIVMTRYPGSSFRYFGGGRGLCSLVTA